MVKKDTLDIETETGDITLGGDGNTAENDPQTRAQQWWDAAMFTEPAMESER